MCACVKCERKGIFARRIDLREPICAKCVEEGTPIEVARCRCAAVAQSVVCRHVEVMSEAQYVRQLPVGKVGTFGST